MSVFGVSVGKNIEQQELVRLIYENDKPIVFVTGNAGTGKTFLTLASALQLQQDKKYSKIIYARNPIQVGESLGYLKGDIDDKYLPFMGPLTDNLENLVRLNYKGTGGGSKKAAINNQVNDLMNRIEICPIAFLRGRSFEDAIVIVDEAQNLDLTALKTVLTRVGKFCKIILLGSMNQIDDWRQRKQPECDFQRVIDKLTPQPYVGYVNLVQSMRSPICVEVDNLLGEIDKPIDNTRSITATWDDGINEGTTEIKY